MCWFATDISSRRGCLEESKRNLGGVFRRGLLVAGWYFMVLMYVLPFLRITNLTRLKTYVSGASSGGQVRHLIWSSESDVGRNLLCSFFFFKTISIDNEARWQRKPTMTA